MCSRTRHNGCTETRSNRGLQTVFERSEEHEHQGVGGAHEADAPDLAGDRSHLRADLDAEAIVQRGADGKERSLRERPSSQRSHRAKPSTTVCNDQLVFTPLTRPNTSPVSSGLLRRRRPGGSSRSWLARRRMTSCCRSSLLKTPFLWPLLMVQATVGTLLANDVRLRRLPSDPQKLCPITRRPPARGARVASPIAGAGAVPSPATASHSGGPPVVGMDLAPLEELAPLAQAVGAVAPRPIAVAPGAVTGMPSSTPVPRTRSHAGLPDVTGYTPAQVEAAIGPRPPNRLREEG